MSRMRTLLARLVIFTLGAIDANAEVTVKEYREAMALPNSDVMRVYIKGLGEGMGWANAHAGNGKSPLYCPPPKLGIGVETFIDIIDR